MNCVIASKWDNVSNDQFVEPDQWNIPEASIIKRKHQCAGFVFHLRRRLMTLKLFSFVYCSPRFFQISLLQKQRTGRQSALYGQCYNPGHFCAGRIRNSRGVSSIQEILHWDKSRFQSDTSVSNVRSPVSLVTAKIDTGIKLAFSVANGFEKFSSFSQNDIVCPFVVIHLGGGN